MHVYLIEYIKTILLFYYKYIKEKYKKVILKMFVITNFHIAQQHQITYYFA